MLKSNGLYEAVADDMGLSSIRLAVVAKLPLKFAKSHEILLKF